MLKFLGSQRLRILGHLKVRGNFHIYFCTLIVSVLIKIKTAVRNLQKKLVRRRWQQIDFLVFLPMH